jgi:hypothetical protein
MCFALSRCAPHTCNKFKFSLYGSGVAAATAAILHLAKHKTKQQRRIINACGPEVRFAQISIYHLGAPRRLMSLVFSP